MKISRRQLRRIIMNEADRKLSSQDYQDSEGREATRSKSDMGGTGTDDQRSGTVKIGGKLYDYDYERTTGAVEEIGISIGPDGQIKTGGSYIEIITSGNTGTYKKFNKGKETKYNTMDKLLLNAKDIGLTEEVLNGIIKEMEKEDVPMSKDMKASTNINESWLKIAGVIK